jgi:hypothetical protein
LRCSGQAAPEHREGHDGKKAEQPPAQQVGDDGPDVLHEPNERPRIKWGDREKEGERVEEGAKNGQKNDDQRQLNPKAPHVACPDPS